MAFGPIVLGVVGIGAQKGTLAIMVGGDKAVFDKMVPVFEAMGTNIRYQGAAGNGQHTKMANQIAITGCVASVCEAITYAKNCGLDPQNMLMPFPPAPPVLGR